jgi:glycosyltransferase involved in cell wall biosynthesis
MKVAALVPAFNEEETIEEVIKQLKKIKILPIIVDDGSTDKTNELAKKAGAIVIKHQKNKGKGEALKTGFKYLKKNHPSIGYIVVVDADLQFSPKESKNLLKPLIKKEADFVIGCRNWSEVPFRHRLGNFVWRTTFNFLFGTRLKDTNCGFIAFKKDLIKKVRIYGGYVVDNALEIQAIKNGFRLKNISVSIQYKHKRGFLTGIRMVLGVLIFIIREGINYRLSKV